MVNVTRHHRRVVSSIPLVGGATLAEGSCLGQEPSCCPCALLLRWTMGDAWSGGAEEPRRGGAREKGRRGAREHGSRGADCVDPQQRANVLTCQRANVTLDT